MFSLFNSTDLLTITSHINIIMMMSARGARRV